MRNILTLALLFAASAAFAGGSPSHSSSYADGGNAYSDSSSYASGGDAHQSQSSWNGNDNRNSNANENRLYSDNSNWNGNENRNANSNENRNTNNVDVRNQSDVRNTALSDSFATGGDATGGEASATGGNSGGNSFDAGDDNSDYLSIGFSAATAAFPVQDLCRYKETRGVDLKPVPVAMSGNNKYLRGCVEDMADEYLVQREFERCVAIADRYFAAGLARHGAAQLQSCGGVTADEPVGENYVTSEQLNRAFEATMMK